MERQQRAQALDLVLLQRPQHPSRRGLAVDVPDDQLGDHRVVHRRDLRTGLHAGVDADAGARGLAVGADPARCGSEVLGRLLGVDTALDAVAAQLDVVLRERERLARGDADLLAHDVDAGGHLGHAVLHLHPRVHLEEEVLVLAVLVLGQQPLDRSGAAVVHGPRRVGGDLADALAHRLVDDPRRGGRLLDQLLVAALDGAVALAQVDDVALRVREHLDLHVARVRQVALEIHGRVGEELLALARGALEGLLQLARLEGDAESLAATAAGGLDGDRVADLLDRRARVLDRLDGCRCPRDDRHARGRHQLASLGLRAHRLDGRRGRPDEDDARLLAGLRERCVLREEPVAGVHGLCAGLAMTSRMRSTFR